MKFNHFRIFITILASFATFFGYICKLNLSIAIEEMVAKTSPQDDTFDYDKFNYDYLTDIRPLASEEATLAWISRSKSRELQSSRMILQRNDARKRANSTAKLLKDLRASKGQWSLAIEFDVNGIDSNNNKQAPTVTTSTESPQVNIASEVKSEPMQKESNLLNWSKGDKDFLLSTYFIGYVIFQVPAARFTEIFGSKLLFIFVGLGTSLCTLLFPLACKWSIYAAWISRILLGAVQSGMFPACYVLLCEWLPKNERSQWLPWPSSFSRIGTIAMYLIAPRILTSYDWETVFYLSGVCILLWTILFTIFGSNSPSSSYWISKDELMHIESHMEPRVGSLTQASGKTNLAASLTTINDDELVLGNSGTLSKPSISWFKLCFNKPILVLTYVMFTSEWSNMLLLIKLPGFLGPALKMDVNDIGLWCSILVAIYCIQYPLSGLFAAKLETSNIEGLSTLRIRKLFEFSAHGLQALGSLMIACSSDRTVITIALVILMVGRATVGGGQCLMPPELSKDYPGTVFAYANSLANLAGFFGPNVVTWMVDDPQSHSSWVSVWVLSALIFASGALVFCLFAENQPQNYCKKIRPSGDPSVSRSQLVVDPASSEPEIFKMDAFARVTSEPRSSSIDSGLSIKSPRRRAGLSSTLPESSSKL